MRIVICNIVLVLLLISILQILEASVVFIFTEEEKECIKQLDGNEREIMYKYVVHETPENDIQFNNYMECSWSKLEYLTKNGDVNYAKLRDSYDIQRKVGEDDPEITNKLHKFLSDAVSKCEIDHDFLVADTAGKTAVRVQNCIVKYYLERVDQWISSRIKH